MLLKIDGWVTNSVDTDQILPFVASDLGLHFLHRHISPNTYGKYSIWVNTVYITKTRLFKYTENFTTKKITIFR